MKDYVKEAIDTVYPLAVHFHKSKSLKINAKQCHQLSIIEQELFGRTLNTSCSGCLKSALGRLYQYQTQRATIKQDIAKINKKKAPSQVENFKKKGIDYGRMPYGELRKLASERGYDEENGRKKAQLVGFLQNN